MEYNEIAAKRRKGINTRPFAAPHPKFGHSRANVFTTKDLARRSRNQSMITLDSRREPNLPPQVNCCLEPAMRKSLKINDAILGSWIGAENAEKAFLLFLSSAISAPLRENLAAGKCCYKNKTFQDSSTKF
jgi:hypothetical protein